MTFSSRGGVLRRSSRERNFFSGSRVTNEGWSCRSTLPIDGVGGLPIWKTFGGVKGNFFWRGNPNAAWRAVDWIMQGSCKYNHTQREPSRDFDGDTTRTTLLELWSPRVSNKRLLSLKRGTGDPTNAYNNPFGTQSVVPEESELVIVRSKRS